MVVAAPVVRFCKQHSVSEGLYRLSLYTKMKGFNSVVIRAEDMVFVINGGGYKWCTNGHSIVEPTVVPFVVVVSVSTTYLVGNHICAVVIDGTALVF